MKKFISVILVLIILFQGFIIQMPIVNFFIGMICGFIITTLNREYFMSKLILKKGDTK